jgi:5-methylcytosine-specific restriction endonuclease McrA
LKVKQLDKFAKNARNKTDGRQPKCKECNRAYYLANQEKVKARVSKDYHDNHEAKLERRRELADRPEAKKKKALQDKAYYLNNKEAISERYKEWAKLNRQRLRDYWKNWYHANLDHARSLSKTHEHRRRSWAKINGNNTLTCQQIEALYDKHPYCEYCKKSEVKLTIDHIIPLSRAGQNCIDNITIACESCNLSKGSKLLSEWILFRDSVESRPGQV